MVRKILRKLSILMMILGACVCMYPQVSLFYGNYERSTMVKEFEQEMENYRKWIEETGESQESSEDYTQRKEQEEKYQKLTKLKEDLQAYNENLDTENQSGFKDAFSYEDSCFQLTEYGLEENIIGTLWIPRMEVELPVYLGATKGNLKKGAALLGNTSMPLGGENTNSVIAAHRGGGSTPMFRNIQLLQDGDKIQITTPFETLIYRVAEIDIILPNETNRVMIQQGRDLLTLVTCHPYTKNSHRYVVIAERSTEEIQEKEADRKEVETTPAKEEEIEPVADELLETAGIRYSETQILLEKYGTIVGAVILVYILISGIGDCIRSRRGR
ncbi:MAG: class C sortase [Lachnospiraceae bacterium]|nr:class C sortase [Lachnospiraceae bacterium]